MSESQQMAVVKGNPCLLARFSLVHYGLTYQLCQSEYTFWQKSQVVFYFLKDFVTVRAASNDCNGKICLECAALLKPTMLRIILPLLQERIRSLSIMY